MSTKPSNSNVIAKALEKWAESSPETPAFIFVDSYWNRTVLSRAELYHLSGKSAALLEALGVKQGDVVCNTLPNSQERVLMDLGTLLLGAIAMDGRAVLDYHQDFYEFLLDTGCNVLLYDPERDEDVVELFSEEMYAVREDEQRFYPNFPQIKLLLECHLTRVRGSRKMDTGCLSLICSLAGADQEQTTCEKVDKREATCKRADQELTASKSTDQKHTKRVDQGQRTCKIVNQGQATNKRSGNEQTAFKRTHQGQATRKRVSKRHTVDSQSNREHRTLMNVLQDDILSPHVVNMPSNAPAVVWGGADMSDDVPRLVLRSHDKFLKLGKGLSEFLSLKSDDVYYSDHAFGTLWGCIAPYLECGATRVMKDYSRPHVDDNDTFFYEVMCKERCTVAFLDQNQMISLARHARHMKNGGDDEPQLLLVERGNKLPTEDKEQKNGNPKWILNVLAYESFPLRESHLSSLQKVTNALVGAYGNPETGLVTFKTVDSPLSHNVGRPATGVQVDIVSVHAGVGEIAVKGDQTFSGYFKDKSTDRGTTLDTRMAVTEGGWVRTGDIGFFTHDGELSVICHNKNAILRCGLKIYPGWLESKLLRYPGIRQVMVVPVPNSSKAWYDLCVCVVREKRARITKEELKALCDGIFQSTNGRLLMAVPEHYIWMESFPSTPDGKPSRSIVTTVARRYVQATASYPDPVSVTPV